MYNSFLFLQFWSLIVYVFAVLKSFKQIKTYIANTILQLLLIGYICDKKWDINFNLS